jgi:hypothetical protein
MDQPLILLHAKFFSQKGIKINMPSFISQLLQFGFCNASIICNNGWPCLMRGVGQCDAKATAAGVVDPLGA